MIRIFAICLFLLSFNFLSAQIDKKLIELEKKAFFETKYTQENTKNNTFNVVYHNIHWLVNPAIYYISGKVTTHFKSNSNNLSDVYFNLDGNLLVDSVLCKNKKIPFVFKNSIINIKLPKIIGKGQIDSLTIYYQGKPPKYNNFGSFVIDKHSGTSVLWTLSEPFGAKDWWPCSQNLYDKIDSLDIFVSVPKGNKVASNGILVSEKSEGENTIFHWQHRYPVATYLVAIAVTNYAEFTHYANIGSDEKVKILNYVYPENIEKKEEKARYTVDVLELFSKLFIPYPFKKEKYGHAEFGWGGGMEHQTMSFVNGFSRDLISHELAHQWFGNHVTCNSWQNIWVNEGFATFCTGLAHEYLHNETWEYWKKTTLNDVLKNGKTGSIKVDDTTNVNRIFNSTLSYRKGAFVLHQLRNQIGDKAFFNGCKLLLTNANTSGKFAGIEQVKQCFEVAGDTNLTTYFDQWIYKQGYPIFDIEWEQNPNDDISIKISQSTTHKSVSCFQLQIPILFVGENNKQKLVKFKLLNNKQTFDVHIDFIIEKVIFDPEYTILAPHPANVVAKVNSNYLKNNNLALFHNPSKNDLILKTYKKQSLKDIYIFSANGKLVLSVKNNNFTKEVHVNTFVLKSGLYFVRTKIDGQIVVKKFMKW